MVPEQQAGAEVTTTFWAKLAGIVGQASWGGNLWLLIQIVASNLANSSDG